MLRFQNFLDEQRLRSNDANVTFNKLLRMPWFRRLWIVQEFVLASDVQVFCGSHVATWPPELNKLLLLRLKACMSLSVRFHEKEELEVETTRSMEAFASLWRTRNFIRDKKTLPLGYLLHNFDMSWVSDPRNHILALLGIATDAGSIGLEVDYARPFRNRSTFPPNRASRMALGIFHYVRF